MQNLRSQHKELQNGFSAFAKAEHHATLAERVKYIEQVIGDNADKHAELARKLGGCALKEHHASLQERVTYLERFFGESADKNAKEMSGLKDAHQESHAQMRSRIDALERGLGTSINSSDDVKHLYGQHKASMEQLLKALENKIDRTAESSERELQLHKNAHLSVKATTEQRLAQIERSLTNNDLMDLTATVEEHKDTIERVIKDLQNRTTHIEHVAQRSQMDMKHYNNEMVSALDAQREYLARCLDKDDIDVSRLEQRVKSLELRPPDRISTPPPPVVCSTGGITEIDKVDAYGRVVERDFISSPQYVTRSLSGPSVAYASNQRSVSPMPPSRLNLPDCAPGVQRTMNSSLTSSLIAPPGAPLGVSVSSPQIISRSYS
jgi:hypothetical protein